MIQEDPSLEIVIYVQQKPASVRHADCLRPMNGATVLAQTLRRLAHGLGETGLRMTVLGHDDTFRNRIAQQVEGTGFSYELIGPLVDSQTAASNPAAPCGFALVDDLRSYVRTRGITGHLLVFPENCVFPDCALTKALVEHHLQNNSDCTIAPGYPFALVPVVLRTEALDRLPRFFVRASDSASIEALEFLFSHLRQWARSQMVAPDQDVAKITVFPESPVPELERAELPLRMTVQDKFSLLAAERVQAQPSAAALDATAARRFKAELVNVYEESRPVRTPPELLSAPHYPVRVLFSSLREAYSGPEQCLLALMQGLDRSRFRPVLVVPRQSLLAERSREAGIDVEISDFAFNHCQAYSFAYWTRIIEDYDVKLVHLDLEVNAALIMAAFHRGIPTIGHVRTVVPEELPEAAYCVDRLIAISGFVATSLRKTYFHPSRVPIIYDGVDTSRFSGKHLDVFNGNRMLHLGMVARLNPGKRQDLLLKAISMIRDPLCVFFYGEADPAAEEYSRLLLRMVQELGLQNKVHFCGFEPDIARMYNTFDALVVCMPGEALGTCTLEALAAGLPVIAPDAGGSREVIRHQEHGLLYTPNDAVSLADTLSRLANDHVLFLKLSRNARKHAESLDIEHHVEKVQALYAELLTPTAGENVQMPVAAVMAGSIL